MLSLERQLSKILNSKNGERPVHGFLGKNPKLVWLAICKVGGHSTYVVKEFPFGSRHKADFVVAQSASGHWEIHLIELEPPNDRVINKDGTPSHRFKKAISQVYDWATYIEQNGAAFRKDLSDWCMEHDLLKLSSRDRPPRNWTNNLLQDQNTVIWPGATLKLCLRVYFFLPAKPSKS
jgi:hypothetical protein